MEYQILYVVPSCFLLKEEKDILDPILCKKFDCLKLLRKGIKSKIRGGGVENNGRSANIAFPEGGKAKTMLDCLLLKNKDIEKENELS